jgi:hypothetical protein
VIRRFRPEALLLHLCVPLRPLEEMPSCLFACVSVSHHDVSHLVVLLEHLHHPLKERLRERIVDDISGVVPHHFGHVVIHDVTRHAFKPQEVFA